MNESYHDLFLSYCSADREAVLEIRAQLESLGITTFLDRSNLNPGQPWPRELEEALASCRAVAVFVGNRPELGAWQLRESWMALDRQARAQAEGESFPVVPVLLPGADPGIGFLFLNTWVDLRGGIAEREGVDQFVTAVRSTTAAAEGQRPETPDICPYRGLEPFRRQDEPFFFGREAFTEELLGKVLNHDLVAVIGLSGSGKSSVVQAGLLPALGRHPEGRAWEVVTMRPGDAPYRALGRSLIPLLDTGLTERGRLAEGNRLGDDLLSGTIAVRETVERLLEKTHGSTRLLLVVDQFEELFRETPEAQRRPFVEMLASACDRELGVVLTMRSDFYDHVLRLGQVADELLAAVVNVRGLAGEELGRLIRKPAQRVGLEFEPGLAEDILREIGTEAGRLPLLEFCLRELWRDREAGRLTHAAYDAIGRVEGALAQRAERALTRLSENLLPAARRLFTDHLVRVATEGEAGSDTKRRAMLVDLTEEEQEVVAAFSTRDTRLLVVDERSVEMVHEALIERWESLRKWIESDRSRLFSRRQRGVIEQVDQLVKRVSQATDFLEAPAEFLEAASRAMFHLARDESPYEAFSEATWRLDYLAKAAPDDMRGGAKAICEEFRSAFREVVSERLGIEPPTGFEGDYVVVEPDLMMVAGFSGVEVEASFLMGSEYGDEAPVHPVILHPFRIGRYQVTRGLFSPFRSRPRAESEAEDRLPVVNVAWHQAYAFAAWLGGRLPTEAEWECACRAETTSRWSFGDDESEIGRYGWIDSNAGGKYHPVGELDPNPWGLHDMHGNVWEWVADWYAAYSAEARVAPQGPAATSGWRVFRGGSFLGSAGDARSAYRYWGRPGGRLSVLGFRVVLPAPCRDSSLDPRS